MMEPAKSDDPCSQVGLAIAEGSLWEDLDSWQKHIDTCPGCKLRVGSLRDLTELIKRATPDAQTLSAGPGAYAKIAFARRARRRTSLTVLGGAGLVAGAIALSSSMWGTEEPTKPVPYAQELFRRIIPSSGAPNLRVLREDGDLRREYERALDNPSSLVRRTALSMLSLSEVGIDDVLLVKLLSEWQENLDSPVVVASASSDARALTDALSRQRRETLRSALAAAHIQAAQGGARVPASVLSGFLSDPDSEVRATALRGLSEDPAYVPGPEVRNRFKQDPEEEVRVEAARCLVARLGPKGAEEVTSGLRAREDWGAEEKLIPLLGRFPAGQALAEERRKSASVPLRLALRHALTLVRRGVPDRPQELIRRALASDAPDILPALTSLVAAGDWAEHREALQERWRRITQPDEQGVGPVLVDWDLRSSGGARMELAAEICQKEKTQGLKALVTSALVSEDARVRARAEELLKSWSTK